MHEEFRGSFAESSSLGMAGQNNNEQITPVKVLVLVAGDTKVHIIHVAVNMAGFGLASAVEI